jgi:hypothetical protein
MRPGGGAVSDDHRRFPRFSVSGIQGRVSFSTSVEILNLSLGGVAIKADRRLELGQEYALRLDLGDRELEVNGIAVWSKLSGLAEVEGGSVPEYSAGFRFMNVLTDKVQDLVDFIEMNKGGEEERVTGIRFQIGRAERATLDTDEECEVKLISRSGMLIQAQRRFEVDAVYTIQILPPGQEPIRFRGRVASQFESSQGFLTRYDLGIEFIDMSETDRKRLESFIEEISGG